MDKIPYKISEQSMEEIARDIDSTLRVLAEQRLGFTLLVYNEDAQVNYISNVAREESLQQMKELIKRWEQKFPEPLVHEVN